MGSAWFAADGVWNGLFALCVTAHAIIVAYVYDPKWKSFAISVPVTFTLAALSLGRPIDATHVAGLLALLMFKHGVRLLYVRFGMPIVAATALSAGGFCAVGWAIVRLMPINPWSFWLTLSFAWTLALALFRLTPARREPGERSALPLWRKVPITLGLVLFLIAMKEQLQGVMGFFPMVGVFAVYEARKSLWTMGRQASITILLVAPMLAVIYICQSYWGLGRALLCGWTVFFLSLYPLRKIALQSGKELRQ